MKSISERNLFRKAPVNRRAVAASAEPAIEVEVESDALSTDISTKLSRLKDVIQDIGRDSETKPDEVRVYHATSSTPKLTPRRVAKKAEVQM
jgi:hypothetical protein